MQQTFHPADNVLMKGRRRICFRKECVETGDKGLERCAASGFRTGQDMGPVVGAMGAGGAAGAVVGVALFSGDGWK